MKYQVQENCLTIFLPGELDHHNAEEIRKESDHLIEHNHMEDVKKAMEPLFTTRPELDRSGMGFSFMEAFMDQVEVSSKPGKGTIVKMQKTIGKGRKVWTTQSL